MKLYSMVLPYLLLVSFGAEMNTFDQAKIEVINNSPYQGVAVPLVSHYDTRDPRLLDFTEAVKEIKSSCRKQLWPWVFFNRFIGYQDAGNKNDPGDKEYFRKIKGMDLFNQTGALGDFLELWRLSLRIARELGSPGIMVDPECYNNDLTFEVDYLAKQLDRSVEEVKTRLKDIGGELMAITQAEYPQAVIWFTHTGIAYKKTSGIFGKKDLPTPAYLVLGMLEKAKNLESKIIIVSGGNIEGYCYESLADLEQSTAARQGRFAGLLETYPQLRLGGTIAPWADSRQKTGWVLRGKCGESHLKDLNDFKPLIQHLLEAYDYVWIYAGGYAGYEAYDAKVSAIYNKALGEIPLPKRAVP
jgi:hypothetical protein